MLVFRRAIFAFEMRQEYIQSKCKLNSEIPLGGSMTWDTGMVLVVPKHQTGALLAHHQSVPEYEPCE